MMPFGVVGLEVCKLYLNLLVQRKYISWFLPIIVAFFPLMFILLIFIFGWSLSYWFYWFPKSCCCSSLYLHSFGASQVLGACMGRWLTFRWQFSNWWLSIILCANARVNVSMHVIYVLACIIFFVYIYVHLHLYVLLFLFLYWPLSIAIYLYI